MLKRVLIVDDEDGIRSFIAEVLQDHGLKPTLAANGQEAMAILDKQTFHLMITDLKMPKMDGMSLLGHARRAVPEMEVIVLTAHGTVDTAVEAMRLGAFDYLRKPLSGPDELCLIVDKALERRDLLERGHVDKMDDDEFIAVDPITKTIVDQLGKVAETDSTVLLVGESGTGKEVAANFLHRRSRRRKGPFVAVNCAAVSEQLVESEMFGHEKGAFTGATETRRGRFELADGGTLFLDEVSEIMPPLQAKLLRVLQERSFERVGGSRTIEIDARIIAATNRNLENEMAAGTFRQDLYHRLAVFPVHIPPLRERRDDIEPLTDYLLQRICRRLGRSVPIIGKKTRNRLRSYEWPGNVRELGNTLERALILSSADELVEADFTLGNPASKDVPLLDGTLKAIEKEAIKKALSESGGHRKNAAERLGIGLRTLYDKLKEYNIG